MGSRISGYLWMMMCEDDTRPDKQELLKEWLYKTQLIDCYDGLGVSTRQSRYTFCDEAYRLVKKEKDLLSSGGEVKKMLLDNSRGKGNTDLSRFNRSLDMTAADPYEVYKELTDDQWDSLNFLYDQRSRNSLAKLIKTFVLHEQVQMPAYDEAGEQLAPEYFHRIKDLLRRGPEMPYLLWKIAYVILKDRQEILPYLFADPTLAALGFVLADEVPFKQDQQTKNTELWKKVTALFLDCAGIFSFEKEKTAEIIFRAFIQLNLEKYRLPYRPQRRRATLTQEVVDSRELREQKILQQFADAKLHSQGTYYSGQQPFLLPEMFNLLGRRFIDFEENHPYRNGTIQFPMAKWDGLFWLMQVSTFHRYKQQFEQDAPIIREISDTFLKTYLQLMETEETEVFDYTSRSEKRGLPSWSEKIERLNKLAWLFPVYNLSRFGLLDQFLSPRITMEIAADDYHEKNRLRALQLRTHIGVLLQVLKKLVLPAIPYGFEKTTLEQIRLQLDDKLISYVKHNSTSDPAAGKVDLFEFNREESLFGGDSEALLPQLARAINWFTNKQAIIEAIQQSGDVRKLLTIGEWVTSHGIRQKLLEQVGQADVIELLEKQRWIPEIQSLLLKISQYPELIGQIEEALVIYEIRVSDTQQDDKYRQIAYRIRLLLAYFKKDEQQLDNEPVPEEKGHQAQDDLNAREYKEFYLGLIRSQPQPASAYAIFDRLFRRYPKFPSLALNRLVAAYNQADITKSSLQYADALAEWLEAAKTFESLILAEVEPNVSTILLNIYWRLNDEAKLDELFNDLDLPYQMLPDILSVWVESLVARDRKAEAFYWIDKAQKFHQFADFADIQFISDLKLKLSGADNVEELIIHYGRIFNSAPEKLICILPERLNGKTDIGEFLTHEFVYANDKMLEKIKSIEEINDENKYNDLIEVILESRINGFGWSIGGQKRGAFSAANGRQPGERDLPVITADGKIIMTGEALIYRGATNAIPHLNKVFNYYHQRERMLVLFYDTGVQGADFKANWDAYQTDVFPKCTFVAGHQPVGNFRDVSVDYKVQNSAIKVGKSILESGGVIYHIFVNINYFLPPLPATLTTAKAV